MDDDTRLNSESADHEPWFEPKRFGYGAGLPINRDGWLALSSYVAVVVVMAAASGPLALVNPLLIFVPVIVIGGATLWFAPLCERRRRGGWRWRWGEKD